jgi:hypothetical protein
MAFHRQASQRLRERDIALEQAFDAAEIAQIEQDFDREYIALFRNWMEHKATHETGSLRRYVAQFRDHARV